MSPKDNQIVLSRQELREIVREAMQEGAKEIRLALGVPTDEGEAQEFVRALHEAKSLVEAWRDTKDTFRRAFVKWATGLFLAAMAAWMGWGAYTKLK